MALLTSGVHLHGGETLILSCLCMLDHIVRFVAANPPIYLDTVTNFTSKKLPDGGIIFLSFDVPQGNIKAG